MNKSTFIEFILTTPACGYFISVDYGVSETKIGKTFPEKYESPYMKQS